MQKAVLLLGEGGAGKSTYLAALEAFVGRENAANLSLHKIEGDKFAAAALMGKLANVCADLPSDHLASTSIFKAITGGDRLYAERKYAEGFSFQPFARLVFSANHPPRSADSSHAFFRRWCVIPFDRSFEEGNASREKLDADLADPSELSGVLNRALDALDGIRERGEFTEPESVREARRDFQTTTDPFAVWLDRHTVDDPEAIVGQDELRRAYNQYAENTGKPGMFQQAFGRSLSRARPDVQKAQRTYQEREKVRVYAGIGLRKPGDSA